MKKFIVIFMLICFLFVVNVNAATYQIEDYCDDDCYNEEIEIISSNDLSGSYDPGAASMTWGPASSWSYVVFKYTENFNGVSYLNTLIWKEGTDFDLTFPNADTDLISDQTIVTFKKDTSEGIVVGTGIIGYIGYRNDAGTAWKSLTLYLSDIDIDISSYTGKTILYLDYSFNGDRIGTISAFNDDIDSISGDDYIFGFNSGGSTDYIWKTYTTNAYLSVYDKYYYVIDESFYHTLWISDINNPFDASIDKTDKPSIVEITIDDAIIFDDGTYNTYDINLWNIYGDVLNISITTITGDIFEGFFNWDITPPISEDEIPVQVWLMDGECETPSKFDYEDETVYIIAVYEDDDTDYLMHGNITDYECDIDNIWCGQFNAERGRTVCVEASSENYQSSYVCKEITDYPYYLKDLIEVPMYLDENPVNESNVYVTFIATYLDSGGYPIDEASITVYNTTKTAIIDTCETNQAGMCKVELPKNTSYKYTGTKVGYQSVSGSFSVTTYSFQKDIYFTYLAPTQTPTPYPTTPTPYPTPTITPTITPPVTPPGGQGYSPIDAFKMILYEMGFNPDWSGYLIALAIIILGMAGGYGVAKTIGGGIGAVTGFVFSIGLGLIPLWVLVASLFLSAAVIVVYNLKSNGG